jgi:hypothetical protein
MVAFGKQISHPVQVIDPAGNGRTKVSIWNIPIHKVIKMEQKCLVEHFYSLRIEKVD